MFYLTYEINGTLKTVDNIPTKWEMLSIKRNLKARFKLTGEKFKVIEDGEFIEVN
jgi:hypothetical protein